MIEDLGASWTEAGLKIGFVTISVEFVGGGALFKVLTYFV